jgi:hypothetical protein
MKLTLSLVLFLLVDNLAQGILCWLAVFRVGGDVGSGHPERIGACVDAAHNVTRKEGSVKDTIVEYHDFRILDFVIYRETIAARFDEILFGSVASIVTFILFFAGFRLEVILTSFSSTSLSL